MLQKLKKEKKDNYKSHKNKIGGSVDIKNKGIPSKGDEIDTSHTHPPPPKTKNAKMENQQSAKRTNTNTYNGYILHSPRISTN